MTSRATKPATSESGIQNEIRNSLAVPGVCMFRANVGQAWTGSSVQRLPNGDLLIKDPRPFQTGLPTGFSDLFGFVKHTVTADDIGRHIAVFAAVEVKTKTGKATDKQQAFIRAVQAAGGRAGLARSAEDAVSIVRPCV
jgi:hypothetical protein